MGECVRLDGENVKLGTCEDLYYVRYEQLRDAVGRMRKLDGNLEPRDYLNPSHAFRYRFPFPDEDNVGIGEFKDYDRGLVVGVPADSPVAQEPLRHEFIVKGVAPRSGGYNVNITFPCPAMGSKAHNVSAVPDRWPVEIVQQRMMEDGSLWTVLRCGWCGVKYRITPCEAEWLAEHVREWQPNPFGEAIAGRILAGYELAVAK